ncbi:hypothetical protein GIB67_024357 [Kingdonia uniflora]|uniref:HMA domain-containing protein n=1 Tax=Kingdonia uniflora TaxID=39325 RepID=A0A7J7LF67_9MAGN|nr:hypothetical protein GIB67_024357 [Kingdonia uniflora]
MVPELEKPRVTEIQVRMDCNGCVQKIKKVLHGINGIYDLNIDFAQQKFTVVGWADPDRIVKAIRKTRKIATICSHTELSNPPEPPTEPAPELANAPPAESPPSEAAPPTEPPKDPPPPTPENPTPEVVVPTPVVTESSRPKDVEEVHVIHHHTSDYGYGYSGQYGHGYWNNHSNSHWPRPEPRPYPQVYMSHNYNTYKPSPYISEYEYPRSSPPRQTRNHRMEHYSEEYHSRGNGEGNNITSMFSDENPNACTIV